MGRHGTDATMGLHKWWDEIGQFLAWAEQSPSPLTYIRSEEKRWGHSSGTWRSGCDFAGV